MAAAAGSRVSVGHRVWSRLLGGSCDVRYLHIRTRLLLPSLRLLFDIGKCYHVVDDSHVLVNSSSDAGTDEELDKHAAAALL